MAKELLKLEIECVTKNERKNGGNVLFAIDVKESDKGATARKAFSYQTADNDEIGSFKTGKKYLITINEK